MSPWIPPAVVMTGLAAIGMALFAMESPDQRDWRTIVDDKGPTRLRVASRQQIVFAVQMELTLRGFDPGPVDGIAGKSTRAAIRAFRAWAGISGDDSISDQLRWDLAHVP